MRGCRRQHGTFAITALMTAVCSAALAIPQDYTTPPKTSPPQSPLKPPTPGTTPGSGGQKKTGDQLVKVTMSANSQEIAPGETIYLAFLFEVEPRWHIYWKNPGSSGAPTEIKISAPNGFTVGKTLFPKPAVFVEEEGTTYGYQDKTALFVPLTAPNDLPAGTLMISAKINWLVCKDVCLMGHATQMTTLIAKSSGGGRLGDTPGGSTGDTNKNPSFQDPLVQKCWHQVPAPLKDTSGAEVTFDRKNLTIKIPAQGLRDATFFPIDCPGVIYGELTVAVPGDHLILTIPIEINPENAQGKPPIAGGLIALGKGPDDPCFEFEHPLTTP